ncbi:glycosyltransferase family 2 protein [Diaminobutyricibacter sp. McL0608]|uniref:glycosyltransferase family 2 protein n=1 Tax=Leifsonia sp. McL0608 TaxID=3143537 RepID=UPI0031F2FFC1
MTAEISVALCTYNGAAFVEEQLVSILDQGRVPDELVISDDGSSDGTLGIVAATVEAAVARGAAPDVVVLAGSTPSGVTANFEKAIARTTRQLIALSDQDDIWHPGRLAALAARFDDDALTFLHTDARLVREDGSPLGATLFESLELSDEELRLEESGRAFDALLRRNLATGATVVFRRELLPAALPFPPEWVHDEWLAVIAAATGRVGVVRESTIDYRQHGRNQIGVTEPTLRYKVGRVLEHRGDRNTKLAKQFRVLADRLEGLGDAVPKASVDAARQKAEFEAKRAAMAPNRLRRIGGVIALARRGLYGRFASRGRSDIIRDLLQPA